MYEKTNKYCNTIVSPVMESEYERININIVDNENNLITTTRFLPNLDIRHVKMYLYNMHYVIYIIFKKLII